MRDERIYEFLNFQLLHFSRIHKTAKIQKYTNARHSLLCKNEKNFSFFMTLPPRHFHTNKYVMASNEELGKETNENKMNFRFAFSTFKL